MELSKRQEQLKEVEKIAKKTGDKELLSDVKKRMNPNKPVEKWER